MKQSKKSIDMQEKAEQMRIGRNSFYVIFALLAISILIQLVIMNLGLKAVIGELIVFLVGGTFATVGYIRNDVLINPEKSSLLVYVFYSIFSAILFSLIIPLTLFLRDGKSIIYCIQSFARFFVILLPLFFISFTFIAVIAKKRHNKLKREYKNEDMHI